MAHYVFLNEQNIVIECIKGLDENPEIDYEQKYGDFKQLICKRTSYNTRGGVHYDPETNESSADQSKAFRKNYAGIGYTYDATRDAFIPPKPYPSWTLNEETCLWESPVPHPNDGEIYNWNEETQTWDLVSNE